MHIELFNLILDAIISGLIVVIMGFGIFYLINYFNIQPKLPTVCNSWRSCLTNDHLWIIFTAFVWLVSLFVLGVSTFLLHNYAPKIKL
jgi:hypothetical protein